MPAFQGFPTTLRPKSNRPNIQIQPYHRLAPTIRTVALSTHEPPLNRHVKSTPFPIASSLFRPVRVLTNRNESLLKHLFPLCPSFRHAIGDANSLIFH